MKKLVKMSGAGNTFLFGKKSDWHVLLETTAEHKKQEIQRLCSRTEGFAADGFVIIEDLNQVFRWHFYNSDGSLAEMCGNAARCAAKYIAKYFGATNSEISLSTLAGEVKTFLLPSGDVQVQMPKMTQPEMSWEAEFEGSKESFFISNTGVPHAVHEVAQLEDLNSLLPLSQWVRHHKFFHPGGTNVTYFVVRSQNEIEAISFERGVEGFTQACGTGAVAAARAFSKKSGSKQVFVVMPGGQIIVEIEGKNSKMSGPAHFIGEALPSEGN